MRNNKGVTLLELLAVIGILGILTAIAVPSMSNFVRRNRMENLTRRIYSDLGNTRVRAMSTNRTHCVVFQVAPVNDYQVISDTSGDEVCAVPPDTQVLRRGGGDINHFTFTNTAVPGNETITENFANDTVIFNRRGLVNVAGTICITAVNIQPARNCIVVNPTWLRVGRLTQGDPCDAAHCDTTIQQ